MKDVCLICGQPSAVFYQAGGADHPDGAIKGWYCEEHAIRFMERNQQWLRESNPPLVKRILQNIVDTAAYWFLTAWRKYVSTGKSIAATTAGLQTRLSNFSFKKKEKLPPLPQPLEQESELKQGD